jgi:type I restriction enzyme S subunit
LYAFKPNNTYSRDQLNYNEGSVKNIHYGDIHTRFATHFRVNAEKVPYVNAELLPEDPNPEAFCQPGDVVFADASEDLADVGKCIEIIEVGHERVLSGSHTILARPRSSAIASGFAGYLFKSRSCRNGIEREAQGTKVMQISPKRLAMVDVVFPPDETEQQRIANCLASLDAMIDAQAEKLDALRTHKRGLMQQLFPAPKDAEA